MQLPDFRPLTDTEIGRLERTLGRRNVEQLGKSLGKDGRDVLAQRVARIVRDVVHLAVQPTLPDHRAKLQRIARQGRLWLREISEDPVRPLVRANTDFEQLKAGVTRFCDQLDAIRRWSAAGRRPGAPRQQLLLQVVIGELIGIAKLAGIRPSSPGRAILPTKPPPRFYNFVTAVLAIGEEIVLTSSLTGSERQAARSVFTVRSEEALIKQIETVRGRVSDYVPSELGHGLVEQARD